MIQLNFPLQAHNNKQWLVLYNYFGFVLPENIGGLIHLLNQGHWKRNHWIESYTT